MSIETTIENTEVKMQFILDENKKLIEIPKEKCKTVEYPITYKRKNAFEVFERVKGTENYWISNYGRCVNNHKSKDGKKFYLHKDGDCHYTIYEIIERNIKDGRGRLTGQVLKEKYKRETSPAELVAETFLVRYDDRTKVWHKDGDEANNWYKNLITVSYKDYVALKAGKVTWQELNLEQEYIEYENRATAHAYSVYNGILNRCRDTKDNDNVRACYDKSTMWKGWIDDPKSFVKWYLEHYYEVEGEAMHVDKDLFGDGSGMYHPDFCCILPQGLNTMLANSKKHYEKGESPENVLPLGVRYNSKINKYYGEITFSGEKDAVKLSYWDTAEEAFEEYRVMKLSDIRTMAAKYKDRIPEYIYKRLLKVDVEMY